MIVFCHKWLHQFDQEDNYKIKIVRRAAACVFSDRVIYCSLERLSFALPLTRLPLPSIYNCSIKILTLLPIGWILFHRSYRIKFYHFTVVSFLLYHWIRYSYAGNGQMQTNLLWLCSSDKNGFFLRGCLNCELKIRRFFGEKCWRRNLSTHSLGNLSGTHLQWTPAARNMEIFLPV